MNKLQIPSSKLQRNPKSQTPNSKKIPNFKLHIRKRAAPASFWNPELVHGVFALWRFAA